MESLVNYESDDGNVKNSSKSSPKESSRKEKRRYSSDDDSSDSSDSSVHERSRKSINEDDNKTSKRRSVSPRKSSHKRSRSDKHKSHDSRSDRHRRRSSSRDSDKYERKKRKDRGDDRDDRKRQRKRSRDRVKRSESRDRRSHSSKDRHRDRSSDRRKDRHDDRKRYSRPDRRYDERKEKDQRRDEPALRNNSHNTNDGRSSSSSSNSSSAIRRAEALNRTIERRANEKVQQLQKLGIEIPALMQPQLRLLQEQQNAQIKPLMSISTGMSSDGLPFNPITATTAAAAAAADETKAEPENLSLNLSNFTSSVLTNAKYTEQMQKKKLIWGAKKAPGPEVSTNNKWEAAKFSQDSDGKVASKFLRLMGVKNATATTAAAGTGDNEDSSVQKREQMFSTMEQQYEIARQVTHTMRGMGLGFGSQSRPC